MQLPLSTAAAASLEFFDETPSTNDVLSQMADAADFSVVATTSQTAGRGRLGRAWVAPRGTSLAVSVLLRPTLPAGEPLGFEHFGWIPLIAGLAMTSALDPLVPGARVALKWPNDVHVDGKKICGILTELRSAGGGVVVGAGVNLTMSESELPIPTATSLTLLGVTQNGDSLVDEVLSSFLRGLRRMMDDFLRSGGDADFAGIRADVLERCSTIGREVRVQMPGGVDLFGTAVDIDRSGRLVVIRGTDGHSVAVAAGDVTHLRYE